MTQTRPADNAPDLHTTLAARYDELYRDDHVEYVEPLHVGAWPRTRNEALVFLARRGGRLLEIGCGRGEVLATLAPHFDDLTGIELSEVRAARTRRALAHLSNVQVLTDPLESLVERGLSFDCIVWADVLEHVADVIAAMRLIARLSRPGAQLITVTPNVAFYYQRLRLLAGKAPVTGLLLYPNEGFAMDPRQTVLHDAGHLHYFTFRQVELLYESAGFRPTRRLGFAARLSRPRDLWPTLLSPSVCVSGNYEGTAP